MYLIKRHNNDFNCSEFVSTRGVDFTLHTDKAQTYKSLDDAIFCMKNFNNEVWVDFEGKPMTGVTVIPASEAAL